MKTFLLSLVLVVSFVPLSASAVVFGGSNLPMFGYTDVACHKPYKPFSFSDQWAVDSYNRDWEQYIGCVNEYIENANNDINRIKQKVNEAIDAANYR